MKRIIFLLAALLLGLHPALALSTEESAEELTLAVVQYPSPDPKEALIEKTAEALSFGLVNKKLNVINVRFSDLRELLLEKQIDFFIASPGIYRELIDVGARDLMTVATSRYPNANRTEAAAIITLSASPLDSIAAIRGKRAAVKSKTGFFSYYVPMREVLHAGFSPEGFFSNEVVINVQHFAPQALRLLRQGSVDVVFLKHCLLEGYLAEHPEERHDYRIIAPQSAPGECARSTRLYPSWVFATAKEVPADISRRVLGILLDVKATTSDGAVVYWGNATDYSEVDGLYRDLKIGPFSYLREWTIKRFWAAYKLPLLIGLGLAAVLFLHYISVNWLVRKRTAELEAALLEQKRLKKRMIRLTQRMDKMQRLGAVSSVVSIFAHEMNQPLASADFYLDSLKNMLRAAGGETADQAAAIDGIEKQTRRCRAIIERVRSFLKAEKRPLARLDFSDLAACAVRDFGTMQLIDVKLETSITPGLWVAGDRLELELVIVNLLKNAAEALHDAKSPRISVRLGASAGWAKLEVSDNGPPIEEDVLRALGESLSSTKTNGLGLGLWVVKGIAARHGASVSFGRSASGGVCAAFAIRLAEGGES